MAFTATRDSSETKAHRVKALALLLIFALMLPISPIWASSEPSTTQAVSATTPGEATESASKKNDLMGFFAIGAIINVLFFGSFILWARKESQKSKKRKTDKQR